MAYIVVCIATRWGSALGGINVFNTGLVKGLVELLPKPSECICVVQQKPATAPRLKGQLIEPIDWTADAIALAVSEAIEARPALDVEEVLVVGHDIYTGDLAVDCCVRLQARMGRTLVKSAVVSHMDYQEYARRKGQTHAKVDEKSECQLAVVRRADYAFAVGPLLSNSFQSARSEHSDTVVALTPGAAEIEPAKVKFKSLSFFIGGRLGMEDDQIKNGVLSVQAVLEAYRVEYEQQAPSRWKTRGTFYACGADLAKDADLLALLQTQVRQATHFELETIPFSDNQEDVYRHLVKCDVALMPSWHEGFGLAGWEAICAGIPLVCSSQSGLALLIEELRAQMPDEKFTSIELVQLSGGSPPGMPNNQDVQTVSRAIRNLVADHSARKAAALRLALNIKRLFTWEGCASKLIGALKWPLATSPDWWQRQKAADAATGGAAVKGSDMVLEALDACKSGLVISQWARACSALNLLSDRAASVKLNERKKLKLDLLVIGNAIGAKVDARTPPASLPIIDTVLVDLCWRYLAAASRVALSFRDFTELLPSGMRDAIFGDCFLQRELLFYAARFSKEFDGRSDDQAISFLAPLIKAIASDQSLSIRLARLSTIHPQLLRIISVSGNAAFEIERARCDTASTRLFDFSQLLEEAPDVAATALALSSLRPDISRQSIDQPIGFIKRLGRNYVVEGAWRGDKRLAAAMMTATLSSRTVLAVLESMAGDEEEAIRWAALDLAFSPVLRARLESMEAAEGPNGSLHINLGRIVDIAVTTANCHPWLAREFIDHYLAEYTDPAQEQPQVTKFTLSDFPSSRELLGPVVGRSDSFLARPMHPDVDKARSRAQQVIKRVLLVLPPILVEPPPGQAASKTSTPPLGLGLLASHLLQQGHDVHLVDCHRFPQLTAEVTRLARTFDLIGFTTVFSTVRATQQMLKDIRGAAQKPMLVVGGPAANLDGWRFSAQSQDDVANWDFVISDDAISNLHRLVDALKTTDPWPANNGIVANLNSTLVTLRDIDTTSDPLTTDTAARDDLAWMNVKLDRRLYTGPDGQYEPGRTRDLLGRVHEAHIVMSKGCDWNCSFCTERRELSGGERRRDVELVLLEIRQLAAKHNNLRLQFIDDNLFPQIASASNASELSREAGKNWAVRFLSGLKEIRDSLGGRLSWRGIFRLEDFAAYELLGQPTGFVRVLAESGCNLLAFGVESGVEATRHSIKAGGRAFTNEVISSLFRRLRGAGIFTKAYFIIGGKKETAASTEATISFAVSSGATLAYFALYKDFVPAQQQLRKDKGIGAAETASLLDYDQLMPRWDEAFAEVEKIGAQAQASSPPALRSPVQSAERTTYSQLANLGFRFQDLVKYNDYHSQEGPAGDVLQRVTWNQPEEFFDLVEQAYRRFYLRPEFVSDFTELVAAGY